jgi:hypothetical protein
MLRDITRVRPAPFLLSKENPPCTAWAIVDLVGKGGHVRTVPVPDLAKAAVDDWANAASISEKRAGSINSEEWHWHPIGRRVDPDRRVLRGKGIGERGSDRQAGIP